MKVKGDNTLKRALVLAGGGSKGAYEVGFVKALRELGIDYNIVTGTSIGSLNGCLLAQKDYNAMVNLWNTMTINDVFSGGFDDDFNFMNIDDLMNQKNLVYSFFKKYLKEKGADITPLKELIRSLLDEDKLLNSDIDFGLCTVKFPSLKPVLITKQEMGKENVYNYLIASASCFPAFPIYSFKDEQYIDGGYYDNVPIDLAFKMGADEVIVVDMHMEATHPHYLDKPFVKYIHPYVDLGMFMDFDRASLDRNIRLGYQVCMKAYGELEGIQYTFFPEESDLFETFYKNIRQMEINMRIDSKDDNGANLFKSIEENYDFKFSIKDYTFGVLDLLGNNSNKDVSYIYDINSFTGDLLEDYEKYTDSDFKFVDTIELKSNLKEINRKGVIGRIYHQLLYPDQEVIKLDYYISIFPKETLQALLLYELRMRHLF